MRSVIKKSLALGVGFLALSVSSARAEALTVNVPFPFLVHGKMLPAGEYTVQPIDPDPAVVMIRGQHSNRAQTAIVLTSPAGGRDPAGEKPALTFTRHEKQYRLSSIWEAGTDGRTVAGS